jgi:nicotinamidase-related amidase
VRTFLIAGVALEVGVEPTVRHSADLSYVPVVVRDACGGGDDAAVARALASIAFAGDALVADTDEVCSILASDSPSAM